MKKEYFMPAIRVAQIKADTLMLDLSNTPADPDEPVLGKEVNADDDSWGPRGNSVWED